MRLLFWVSGTLFLGMPFANAQLSVASVPAGMRDKVVAGGSAEAGKEVIREYGCVACHVIGGLPGPYGKVGPSLAAIASRAYIAGSLPNRPQDMVAWLLDPPRHVPSTAMPNLGLSEAQAKHIAAYLYRLK